MLQVHRDIIISNLSVLVEETDLRILVPELLKRDVFNEQMITRILNPAHDVRRQKTDLYVAILGRGPTAFAKLRDALESTNHTNLAEILEIMDLQNPSQFHRSSSLNSVGSNVNSSDDSDGPCLSACRKTSRQEGGKPPDSFSQPFPADSGAQGPSSEGPSKLSDSWDFPSVSLPSPNSKVFVPPAYANGILDENQKLPQELMTEHYKKALSQKFKPVNVVYCKDWKVEGAGKPRTYKMDSNPRGCALIVNNMKFHDSEEYPNRVGADNDDFRLKELLLKFHFQVEVHRNKTKREMEEIVDRFSKKPELNNVDCIWVTFMSHGQEGATSEDSEIIGVDGIGYKTNDIVSTFYNDNCKALMGKPKIFTFQACRGDLCDPGVLLGNLDISRRIETDGKRITNPSTPVKIRTQEDIFIAYPTPGGISANRDRITGTWFIQAVVDEFSRYACTSHLEDLLKLVDQRIKKMNNFHTDNFQSVTTKTIGWSKNLYFNPGLWKDKLGATIRLRNSYTEEGMDVVDSSTTTDSGKNGNGTPYGRLKDDKDEEDSDHGGQYFNFHCCNTS